MSMSNPLRPLWHVGIMSGIPLLALALGTGDAPARSLDRSVGAGASRKTAAPTTAGSATGKTQSAETWRAGTRNHDPCCGDDARTPSSPAGTPAARSREAGTPAAGPREIGSPAAGPREAAVSSPSDAQLRGKSDVRRGGTRIEKRTSDPRLAPRSTPAEQRRGGVGALIGLTFA